MAAPKENQFWKARSSHGRKPKFPDPETLAKACEEYFEWVDTNPLYSTELTTYQGVSKLVDVPRKRPYTLGSLCLFLDITPNCWYEYGKRKDFMPITTAVEHAIREQKFAGAAAGFFNPNIIARDLGLKDVQSRELSGPNGTPVQVLATDDPAEAARAYQELLGSNKA